MTKQAFFAPIAALIAALSVNAPVAAAAKDTYPNKPVRMVIPFAAGGFSDVVGRIVTQKLSENIGQSVVADNRPGASGIIGSEIVARAAPDGYTLLLNSFNHVVNPSLMRLPYDPIKGFTVISMMFETPTTPARSVPTPTIQMNIRMPAISATTRWKPSTALSVTSPPLVWRMT